MLIVNKNSYVDTAEADAYIETNYLYEDPLRVVWSVFTENEKEVYLSKSLKEIENLMFSGRKTDCAQELCFPRDGQKTVTKEVKEAQIENALSILKDELSKQSDKQFNILQSLGVVKNTKYNKREQGEIGLGADITGKPAIKKQLSSEMAEYTLSRFMGSYRM